LVELLIEAMQFFGLCVFHQIVDDHVHVDNSDGDNMPN
jgi:hypothetical protein